MALAAAHVRFSHIPVSQRAIGGDTYHPPQVRKRPLDVPLQDQVFAGIGLQEIRHWTGLAKITRPALGRDFAVEQPAFLLLLSAVIITIKISAFFAGRCTHHPLSAGYVRTAACIYTNRVADIY